MIIEDKYAAGLYYPDRGAWPASESYNLETGEGINGPGSVPFDPDGIPIKRVPHLPWLFMYVLEYQADNIYTVFRRGYFQDINQAYIVFKSIYESYGYSLQRIDYPPKMKKTKDYSLSGVNRDNIEVFYWNKFGNPNKPNWIRESLLPRDPVTDWPLRVDFNRPPEDSLVMPR